jgi:hypothetical protein
MVDTGKARTARLLRAAVAVAAATQLLMAGSAPVAAHHDLYRRVSAGARLGNGALPASFAAASSDGKRAFFLSTERLTLQDTDSSFDIFERSAGTTRRVSMGAINGNGAFPPVLERISSDGTRAFFTTEEQLVAADTDTAQDVYQRSAGATTLVSTGAINGNGNFGSAFRGISSDGTHVLFTTSEKLVSGDTDSFDDVYDRSGGTTNRVSVGSINGNQGFNAGFAGVSANGTRVWFITSEKLVAADTDSQFDVYQGSGGQTFLISRGVINGNGPIASSFAGASSDGSRVFFVTTEQLVTADTDIAVDIYEFSPGGVITLISAGAINGNGGNNAIFMAASADGTRVLFQTNEQLVTGDTDSAADIYQRLGGVTSRVSVGAINGNGAQSAFFDAASSDGSRVFFDTSEKLVAGDTDASLDIYEFSAGTTKLVSTGTINGNGGFSTSFGGISADGTRVFFRTAEQLATDDDDTTMDIYERAAGQTDLVSIGAANVDVIFKVCSIDGLAVFFETTEKLLTSDKDAVTDVYGAYDAF